MVTISKLDIVLSNVSYGVKNPSIVKGCRQKFLFEALHKLDFLVKKFCLKDWTQSRTKFVWHRGDDSEKYNCKLKGDSFVRGYFLQTVGHIMLWIIYFLDWKCDI